MADVLDLITIVEGYDAINSDVASGHDAQLGQWITGISRRVDDLCGPVVERTVTGEVHDGGRPWVRLSHDHASVASSVSEFRHATEVELTAETNASKPADGYLLDPVGGGVVLLRRRRSGTDATFADGRRNVVVTYTAGRYATTAAVDAKFKLAASAILRRLWQRDQGAWATGGDPFDQNIGMTVGFFKVMDPMIHEWLHDELRTPSVA